MSKGSQAYWNALLKRKGLGMDSGRLPKGIGPRAHKMVRVSRQKKRP